MFLETNQNQYAAVGTVPSLVTTLLLASAQRVLSRREARAGGQTERGHMPCPNSLAAAPRGILVLHVLNLDISEPDIGRNVAV